MDGDQTPFEQIVSRNPRVRRLLYRSSLLLLKTAFRIRRLGLVAPSRVVLHISQYLFRCASSRPARRNTNKSNTPFDSRYAARRLFLKLVIILIFAAAQSPLPWGFGQALTTMLFMSAAISCVLAAANHERFRLGGLSYWDEGLAFALLGQAARMVLLR